MKRLLITLLLALPFCANAGYLGEFRSNETVTFTYLTTNGAGTPTYPATAPNVTVSCDDGTTITERLALTAMTLRVAADVNTATHSGGTTTTFVDAALTGVDDYIKNMRIKWDTGSNAGQEVKITGFVASTDTVTFSPAVPVNVATTDDYTIVDPRWHTKHTIAASDGDVCTVLMEDATDGGNPEIATYSVKDEVNSWVVYNVVDLTNEGGNADPTTTAFDTDMPFTNNLVAGNPAYLYFPHTAEEAGQSASCNVMGETFEVTSYNGTTKVVTSTTALSLAPDYRCVFVKD